MAKTSGNKMKAWRREAAEINEALGSKHKGRMAKQSKQMQSRDIGPVASPLIAGLFERGGIRMPKAEMFRDMMNRLKAEHDAKVAAEAAATEVQPETETVTTEEQLTNGNV